MKDRGNSLPEDVDDMLLSEARRILWEHVDEGIRCACCDQLARRWKRQIYRATARWLIKLVKKFAETDDWIHTRQIITRGGDHAKLRFWDLIEEKPKDPDDKTVRTSGFWRPTFKGIRFANARLMVPKIAVVYDNVLQWHEGELVSIRTCLGKDFDYEALWRA